MSRDEETQAEPTIYGWADSADLESFEQLAAALADRRTKLVAFDPHADQPTHTPVVVFVSPAFLRAYADQLITVKRDCMVIPLLLSSLPPGRPEAVEELSPFFPGEPLAKVTTFLAVAARAVPEWLGRWRELEGAARRYELGDPGVRLLSAEAARRARTTIRERSVDLLPSVPTEESFVARSERAARRKAFSQLCAYVATAVVLLGIGVVAFVERQDAATAAKRARAAAIANRADRLARLSGQWLGGDPDLPILLARRAYALEPSNRAWEAVRKALDANPRHRSYPMPRLSDGVLGSLRSNRVAVIGSNGSVRLVDTSDGRSLGQVPLPTGYGGLPVGSVSPDGDEVALAYNGGLVEVRQMTEGLPLVSRQILAAARHGVSASIVWSGAQRLVSAWRGRRALEQNLATGSIRPFPGRGIVDPIAIAAEPDGDRLALADHDAVEVVDPARADRRCLFAQTDHIPNESTLAFDVPRKRLVLARKGSFGTQFVLHPGCVGQDRHSGSASLPSLSNSAISVLPDGAVAAGGLNGEVNLVGLPSSYPAKHFLADVGGLGGLTVTKGGAMVSVGADAWLRVWHLPPAPVYPVGTGDFATFYDQLTSEQNGSTWRSMLAIDPSGGSLSVGDLATGQLFRLDTKDLGRVQAETFQYIGSSIRPIPDRPCSSLTLETGGSLAEAECGGKRAKVLWQSKGSVGDASSLNTAVSDSGRTFALADAHSLAIGRIANPGLRIVPFEGFRSMAFDGREELFALGAGNSILDYRHSDGIRTIPIGGDLAGFQAVVPNRAGSQILLLGSDGIFEVVNAENGRALQRFRLGINLHDILDAEISGSGRLVLVVTREDVWIIDLPDHRILFGSSSRTEETGAQPRAAVFDPDRDRRIFVLRADGGIETVPLAHWLWAEGQDVLRDTARFVPRALRTSEEHVDITR
jgi:hypothetical protein